MDEQLTLKDCIPFWSEQMQVMLNRIRQERTVLVSAGNPSNRERRGG